MLRFSSRLPRIWPGLLAALLLSVGPSRGLYAERPADQSFRTVPAILLERADGDSNFPLPPPVRRSRPSATPRLQVRLAGEFERQAGLAVGCGELMEYAPELLLEIVRHTAGRMKVVALVSDRDQLEAARAMFRVNRLPDSHVLFAEVAHDTMWIRDYGPITVRNQRGGATIVDADYDVSRLLDDEAPTVLAKLLHVPVVRLPLRIDGGNLLSNGAGLAISTTRMLEENGLPPSDLAEFRQAVERGFGLRELVMLEPLEGETTGHIDMFAAFTSPNTVVVARMRAEDDPLNNAILDRNADRLAAVKLADGKLLRVVRIPMPPTNDGVWRTYANVVFVNGVLLTPIYSDVNDAVARNEAMSTFSRLLPGWRVVGVDASRIIESAGALHCISMNLDAALKQFPAFPAPTRQRAAPPLKLEDLLLRNADSN